MMRLFLRLLDFTLNSDIIYTSDDSPELIDFIFYNNMVFKTSVY